MALKKWSLLLVLNCVIATPGCSTAFGVEPRLEAIHAKIEADYEDVSHIEARAFSRLDVEERIVFDVRERDEFAVSHIAGAIRVSPDIGSEEFVTAFGDRLAGKTVVFYCSVGRRASILASRVNALTKQHGARRSYNLTGGLFSWRNEERPLVQGEDEPTTLIHPNNFFLRRLITDKSAISYVPRTVDSTPERQ